MYTSRNRILLPLNSKSFPEEKSFNVFDSISKFESFLINEKRLIGKNKKSYKMLISKLNTDTAFQNVFSDFFETNFFLRENTLTSNFRATLLEECPYYTYSDSGIEIYHKQKLVYEKVFLNEKPNSEILTELANLTEYKSDIQRLILCQLIYEWLTEKINE